MIRSIHSLRPALLACLLPLAAAAAPAAEPPRLLRQPSLSADRIAFVFAGDLWSAPRAGGDARRLTASAGVEQDPVFSPDGRWIAFSGEYDGNVDLFVMPADGGEPRRLTWHPGEDRAVAWTRDGREIVFRSLRDNGLGDDRLWSVPAEGGWPRRLPLPEAYRGSFSPDGRRLAYMPHERFQLAWKRYRGGESTFVWLVDLDSLEIERVPRERSNDSWPAWAEDGRVYFLSDREGAVTLFRYDPATRAVERVFANDGFDLKNAQAGPGAVVFERFGEIGLYDLASGATSFPSIRVGAELEGRRPRFAKVGDSIQGAAISPSGARAAFAARGEIFTLPAEKGDPRNLTRSPGAADRDPAWSPDGQSLAWLSDASGEYALHVVGQSGLGEPRRIPLGDPPTFYYQPLWSPDGERIALHDKARNLWVIELDSGARTRVDTDPFDGPVRTLDPAWSPDGRFLAYTKSLPSRLHALFVWEAASGRTRAVTDGLADARFPAFDASGKYLWFTASTDWGPTAPWLDMTSVEHPVTRSLWVAILAAGEPSPFGPESDEEKAEKADAEAGEGEAKKDGKDEKKAGAPPRVRIDFDGLARRTVAVPKVPARNYQALAAGKAGEVFLLESPEVLDADAEDFGSGALQRYRLEKRELKKLADDVAFVRVSKDGEKLLLRSGETWTIAGTAEPVEAGKGALPTDALEMRVDPPAEWRQMYREAWRLQRDFFYDPGYHGLDLAAAEKRYERYVDGLGHRSDLNYLFQEMLGELSVGHLYVGGGDLPKPPKVKGGLLGADWELVGDRYRIARVLDGESWNPELQAPLARPGVDARAGEYLIEVEGRPVRAPASIDSFFEATAGRSVRIRLSADPSGRNAREVTVVPVESENGLRRRAWVEDNRRTVERLSAGRLGYLHLPNTAGAGYTSFNRYFYPQIDRLGMVVDERYNGGGLVADYIIEALAKSRPTMYVVAREGEMFPTPAGALFGPKVMLINRHAGSGGDALPWLFRDRGIGPLVGTRTWGGLVGIWDYPPLVDGGRVTAPRGALFPTRGRWEIENQGVTPDHEIEILPADFRAGRDPQLEKAVELALAELAESRPPAVVRPEYPNYQVSPWRSEARP